MHCLAESASLFKINVLLTYLECCISLMLTSMSRDDVAEILRAEAEMVSDFD